MSEIKIERLTRISKEDYESIGKLLPQLSSHASVTEEELNRIVDDKNTHIFVARDAKRIVGMGMLVITPILVERRGRLEDMVVDEEYRGRGIGRQLTEILVIAARGRGLNAIEFSSRPDRAAANALYKKFGFEQKETNVYRLEL